MRVMSVNLEKLKAVVLFIGAHPSVSDLGQTKLYKLIYFSDVRHLRATGSSITGSEYIKYQHGPVPSRGEKAIKQLRANGSIDVEQVPFADYVMNKITVHESPSGSVLTPSEIETLSVVCESLGRINASSLSRLSHDEPAWVYAEQLQKLSPELMMYGHVEDVEGL